MKLFFTFILSFSIMLCHAQDLSLNESAMVISTDNHPYYGDIVLTNNGTNSLDIGITVESVCYVDGDSTSLFICSIEQCLGYITATSTFGDEDNPFITLAPGASFEDITIFPENMIEGIGAEWNFIYFEIGNPDNNASVNIKTEGECAVATGTKDLIVLEQAAYPNPASDFINIPFSEFEKASACMVYNYLGILMDFINLENPNKELFLDVSNYNNGVYFYQVSDKEKKSNVRSFIKR